MAERWIVKRYNYAGGSSVIASDLLEEEARSMASKINADYQSSNYVAEQWVTKETGFVALSKSASQIAFAAVNAQLEMALYLLRPDQQDLFHRVYPTVSEANVNAAYDLVKRSLEKNERAQADEEEKRARVRDLNLAMGGTESTPRFDANHESDEFLFGKAPAKEETDG